MLCSGATWLAHSTSTGDWWCAVGAYNSFQGGLPGWGGVAVKGGLELWIRYDNVSNNIAQIYSNKLIAKEIIEL